MLHDVYSTARKISLRLGLIEGLVYRKQQPLVPFKYFALSGPEDAPLAGPYIDDSKWETIQPDSYWSGAFTDFVLRTRFSVPIDWPADVPVALYLPLSMRGEYCRPESLAYLDGTAYVAVDGNHQEVILPPAARDGREHLLALRGWTGRSKDSEPEPGRRPYLRPCALVQIDQPTRDLVAKTRVALDTANHLDENDPSKAYILNALDEAFKLLDIREPVGEGFYASVPRAHEALQRGLARAGRPLDISIIATGHSHIDVAWLWTLAQVRRKAGRTFHTVARLMEQYPEYHFTQSQPQLYDYVRLDYPEIFETIKKRVREGRWEPIGGMWVEADCNLSGAESLARQFVLGRGFFRKHFGADAETPVLWLPDVFGYAWNLPQLIKQAGLEYFFTIKLSWNRYNRIPYDSFWWQGLDGTKVLTHFSPTPDFAGATSTTYNAMATPEQTIWTWKHYNQKELQAPLLMAYGYGDGGGGPTREMIENIRELQEFPGSPRLCQGSVRQFFQQLEASEGERLPTWNGELYLEMHRGTYTSQARNKRANRQSEFLLHDAEFLAAYAAQIAPGYRYPAEDLAAAWQLVCLNQFHDIIPGSSINEVYEVSQQQYAEVRERALAVRNAALEAIGGAVDWEAASAAAPGDEKAPALVAQGSGNGHSQPSALTVPQSANRPAAPSTGLLLVNPSSFRRTDLAFWRGTLPEGTALRAAGGAPVRTQETEHGTWLAAGDLAPYSVAPLASGGQRPTPISQAESATATRTDRGATLENAHVRADFNLAGDLVRLYDKANRREVLAEGAVANQFQAFEDRPASWDAWDVEIFFDDKMWLAEPASSIEVLESGPLHATLEIRRRILNSEYVQRVSLRCDSPRLDFETTVDWHERHVLLKVAFPVDVLAATATYEVQWGNVERPTHRNTSWDWARFETCAQKWVDLSEGGYGVSLLNNCKYGHDIRDNVIRLSLLRSPTLPDPEADQGEQCFTYGLLPHAGRWNERTISEAYALNDPLIVHEVTGKFVNWESGKMVDEQVGEPAGQFTNPPVYQSTNVPFISVDAPNVVIETVKQAEDGDGIVVRLYESQRRRGPVTLTGAFELGGAWRTNLLEEDPEALEVEGRRARFYIKPYEIVTLRLVPVR